MSVLILLFTQPLCVHALLRMHDDDGSQDPEALHTAAAARAVAQEDVRDAIDALVLDRLLWRLPLALHLAAAASSSLAAPFRVCTDTQWHSTRCHLHHHHSGQPSVTVDTLDTDCSSALLRCVGHVVPRPPDVPHPSPGDRRSSRGRVARSPLLLGVADLPGSRVGTTARGDRRGLCPPGSRELAVQQPRAHQGRRAEPPARVGEFPSKVSCRFVEEVQEMIYIRHIMHLGSICCVTCRCRSPPARRAVYFRELCPSLSLIFFGPASLAFSPPLLLSTKRTSRTGCARMLSRQLLSARSRVAVAVSEPNIVCPCPGTCTKSRRRRNADAVIWPSKSPSC